MQQAGLDYDRVLSCTANETQLAAALSALNSTRAPMYNKLGPSPGLFPHIFVDGEHLFNNSWAALTRLLCAKLQAASTRSSPQLQVACTDRTVDAHLQVPNVSATAISSNTEQFLQAVQLATDLALSKEAFPVNFEYQNWPDNTDPDPNGAPSYVNTQAISRVQLLTVTPIAAAQPEVSVKVRFEVLEAFEADLGKALDKSSFSQYLLWALSEGQFELATERLG